MKDSEGERTKISREMEGVRDEPAQEEREWRTQKDSQERWVKHELRSIRSSVMVLSPLRGGQAKLTSLFIFFLFKIDFYSTFKHLVPLVFRVPPDTYKRLWA